MRRAVHLRKRRPDADDRLDERRAEGRMSAVAAAGAGASEPRHARRIALIWLAVTSVIGLSLAVYGTADLLSKAGVGGGEGPSPLAKPSAAEMKNAVEVQVIGQQWLWTFRYPGYGGFETSDLIVPVGREI